MGFRRLTVAVIVGVLAVLSIACTDDGVTMPDLSGMRKDEATATLRENGIEDWSENWSEGPNPLVVVDQEPNPGEPVGSDTEVEISLSGE